MPCALCADLRAKARQLAQIIASDTQPVQNLRVLNMVQAKTGSEKEKNEWGLLNLHCYLGECSLLSTAQHWIINGLKGVL